MCGCVYRIFKDVLLQEEKPVMCVVVFTEPLIKYVLLQEEKPVMCVVVFTEPLKMYCYRRRNL